MTSEDKQSNIRESDEKENGNSSSEPSSSSSSERPPRIRRKNRNGDGFYVYELLPRPASPPGDEDPRTRPWWRSRRQVAMASSYDEHVSQLIRRPPTPRPKPQRYVSKFRDDVRREASARVVGERRTMGEADLAPCDPTRYLKRTKRRSATTKAAETKEPDGAVEVVAEGVAVERRPRRRRCATAPRPPVPRARTCERKSKERGEEEEGADEGKEDGEKKRRDAQKKNFVASNVRRARSVGSRAPPSAPPLLVDSPGGHRRACHEESLKYVHSPTFGSIPRYLVKRKTEKEKAEREYRQRLESQKPLCNTLDESQRRQILGGLRENWRINNKSLLCLPLVIDTITKINRKLKIEKKLKELEEAIQYVETNPYIYVYDDDDE